MIIKNFSFDVQENCKLIFGLKYTLLETLTENKKIFLLTDSNLYKLYPQFFENYEYCFVIEAGEESKNLNTISEILNVFEEKNVDKDFYIIGFGGGVVCDITGFAASIYRRGIKCGLIPTSFLAQIDAALGGKNGINFKNLKNYIGTIRQPEFVLIDPKLLKTLDKEEFYSGLGELMKYAIIDDSEFFEFVFNNKDKILNYDFQTIEYAIKKSCEIKMEIVSKDPFDNDFRHVLNLGHSFGHIYELKNNLKHGIAVVQGIYRATELSLFLNKISDFNANKIFSLLKIYDFENKKIKIPNIEKLIFTDKKSQSKNIKFILPEEIGRVSICDVNFDQIKNFVNSEIYSSIG